MFVAVWRYRVADAQRARFEAAYGADGAWARLFRLDPGYAGTELLGDGDGVYLTLDRWTDEAAWDRFKALHGDAYAELDAQMESLTVEEERIGGFSA
jgi:heme-degrading monooxygenase HmoA